MALSGLQVYKLLPQTNCKECGYPTCLAFAMKLAAKQAELAACPYVSEESKGQLEAASAPPIRLVTVASDGAKIEAGNETVLFRHEKTFYHRPGLLIRVQDTDPELAAKVAAADRYVVDYVGIKLGVDGFAVEAASGNGETFRAAVETVRAASKKPLALVAASPEVMSAGVGAAAGTRPLLYAADRSNWQAMVAAAKSAKAALVIKAESLEALAALAEEVRKAGVEDIVLDPMASGHRSALTSLTQIRRLALKKNFRALGYPAIGFAADPLLAGQLIAKYAGFVVLEEFDPATVYPLLVLRQNIYTDPQKPIQVQPGLYEINSPDANAPVMVTTNFSITYFAVANEVESAGLSGWLCVVDADGMSVLTGWAAGKFDADRIAKAVHTTQLSEKLNSRRLIIPGHVAILLGDLEEVLPDWQIRVGPKEAVDLPAFLKTIRVPESG